MMKECDRLCRNLVVELRDKNTCQRCEGGPLVRKRHAGVSLCKQRKIDWAHVYNRQHTRLRHDPIASLALCSGCHLWFDGSRRKGWEWFRGAFQARAKRIDEIMATPPKRVVLEATKLWLTAEIKKAEAAL